MLVRGCGLTCEGTVKCMPSDCSLLSRFTVTSSNRPSLSHEGGVRTKRGVRTSVGGRSKASNWAKKTA